MTRTIMMTEAQTRTYDDGDGPSQDKLARDLRAEARELADEIGAPVEIQTADGILAWVVVPTSA